MDVHAISMLRPGSEVFLVHTDWAAQWRVSASRGRLCAAVSEQRVDSTVKYVAVQHFVSNTMPAPGIIPNHLLCTGNSKLLRLKATVLPTKDFRPVSPAAWKFLFERYGASAVISTVIPKSLTIEECRTLTQPASGFRWADHSRAVVPSANPDRAASESNLLSDGPLRQSGT